MSGHYDKMMTNRGGQEQKSRAEKREGRGGGESEEEEEKGTYWRNMEKNKRAPTFWARNNSWARGD